MAYQLRPYAKYLLSSQIGIPLPGWPYTRILERLSAPKGSVMGPAEFGAYAVRRFCEQYHAEERAVSLTMLDLGRADEVSAWTEVLALRLAKALDEDADERQVVFEAFRRAQTDASRPFVDVADLCLNLVRECQDPYVVDAAERLGDLLIASPPKAALQKSVEGGQRPFVVEHGRNTCRTAKLHGVNLYAPHVADAHVWQEASYWYKKFAFVQKTSWSGLVHALAQRS